jgi:hypothetical protein
MAPLSGLSREEILVSPHVPDWTLLPDSAAAQALGLDLAQLSALRALGCACWLQSFWRRCSEHGSAVKAVQFSSRA